MFGKIKDEKKSRPMTFRSLITRCGIILAFMFLAFAIEKIGGTGEGKFFDITKALSLIFYCVAYIIAGRRIVILAIASLFQGKIEIEKVLVTVLTLVCILIGQYFGAVLSMLVFFAAESLLILENEQGTVKNLE